MNTRVAVGGLREALERLGGGCDANNGGLHSVMGTGKDSFCPDCGLMLKRVAYVLPHIKPSEVRQAFSQSSCPVSSNDQIEQVISAWAFAHNIDGAARNDLFKRLNRIANTLEASSPIVGSGVLVERLATAVYLQKRNRQRRALDHEPLPADYTVPASDRTGVFWSDAVEAVRAVLAALSIREDGR